MSSARGRGARGRGSGQPPQKGLRGASTGRGGTFRGNSQRGNTAARGLFGQPSRGNATKPAHGASAAPKTNGFHTAPSQAGAFGATQTRTKFSERYDALSKARERERAQAIRQGLIADPDKPRSLAEAITPVGTCQDMCAEYERVERVVQNDVWQEETDPDHSVYSPVNAEPDEARMVKKFRRAAAGLEEQLPSDLRPPGVLKRTCDYLFDEVVGNAERLEKVHHFVWDRTRAIRNDFSIQQLSKLDNLATAIDCYERIARFHILSLHLLAVQPKPYDRYDAQQEREQLDRTLLSLMQYYDDCRERIDLPNEAEFRAYCVIFQLQDPIPDMEDRAQSWPRHIVRDRRVQAALSLYAAACNTADAQGPLKPRANHLIAQQDWQCFWILANSKQVSYLMGCVAEIYFNLVRRMTLNALFRACRGAPTKPEEGWTIDVLLDLFNFEEEDQVYTFCNAYGFSFVDREDGQQRLDLFSVSARDLPQPDLDLPKQWRSALVEDKRFGRTLPSIISGRTVKQAEQAGQVVEEEHEEEMADVEETDSSAPPVQAPRYPFQVDDSSDPAQEEDSLFVPEDRKPSQDQPAAAPSLTNGFGNHTNGHATKSGVPSNTSNGFSFGGPSTSAFGKPSGGDNASTTHAENVPADNSKKSLFNFGAIAPAATQPAAQRAPASVSAPSPVFPKFESGSFSFNGDGDASKKPVSGTDTGSIPSKPPSAESSPTQTFPFFAAAKQAKTAPETTGNTLYSDYKQPTVESVPTSPEKIFTFGQQPSQPPPPITPTSPPSHTPQPETKPSQQPHFTASNPSQTSANQQPRISPERRASLQKDRKPKKPSPLAQSFSAEEEIVPTANGSTSELKSPVNVLDLKPDATLRRLAEELFSDETYGFLTQYIDYTVQHVIADAQEQVHVERLTAEAEEFRFGVLIRRYWKRWRDRLWRSKSAKRGSQRRERARRGLEEMKRSGNNSRASSVVGAGESFLSDQKDMMDSVFRQTVRDGAHSGARSSQPQAAPGSKRPLSSHGANDAPPMREPVHKRQRSASHVDERGRIAKTTSASDRKTDLLKRSSFLGFSMANSLANRGSTTHTNYFREKARGLDTIAEMAKFRGTKRKLSESVKPASAASPTPSFSAFMKSTQDKSLAKTSMLPPTSTPKKDEADEALFARLKAAREGLAETASLLKQDIAREEELRRSFSASQSQSSNDSPSMIRARAEARWRASQAGSALGTPEPQRDVPAYRLRESKFVPKEHYSKAIERARELRKSRSRETSRPASRFGDSRFDESVAMAFDASVRAAQEPLNGGFGFLDSQSQSQSQPQATETPNGSLYPSLPQWQPPAPVEESKPFSWAPQQQPSWSFTNAGTQQSEPQEVFGKPAASNAFSSFRQQPTFDNTVNGTVKADTHDLTIQPSQVEQSLSNSFGHSQGFGQSSLYRQAEQQTFIPQDDYTQEQRPDPAQPDSYMQSHVVSQAISLVSDDEEEDASSTYATQLAQQAMTNGIEGQTDDNEGEILDHVTDDQTPNSYQHTNPYATNPYAALASDSGAGDTDEDVDEEQSEGPFEDEGSQDLAQPNGYYDQNGYEDEDEVDGDIEDAGEYDDEEFEEEEDDEATPRTAHQRFTNGNAEEYDEEEYDEEETEGSEYQNTHVWNQEPPKSSALQGVGGNAEEAIELSD